MARTTLRARPRHPSTRSDADLVVLTRAGDDAAFAELWERHARAGLSVARSITSSFDADDLVSESFAKILNAITSGGGPTSSFRAYLFTTIRNTAAGWGRARNEIAIDDADEIEDPTFSETNTLAALDRSLTAQAFRSLPTRWQEVLWYNEVEQLTPLEIAPLLGMKANSVAALAYRAREGLRQAWIQAHLASTPAGSECRWTTEHLGAYARHGLGRRDTARVEEHLESCAKCTIVASEAREVGSRLALVLLPLAAGIAGAAGYTAWLQSGAHTTAAAIGLTTGATGSAGAVPSAAAVGTTSAGISAGSVTAGVLVVAGAAAAIAFGPALVTTVFATPSSASADSSVQRPTTSSPIPAPVAPTAAEAAPADPSPAPDVAPVPEPVPETSPGAGETPTSPPTVPPVTAPPASTPPTPPSTPPDVTVPDAPTVDSPASLAILTNAVSLILTGHGASGSIVSVAAATTTVALGSTTVAADGSWALTTNLGTLAEGTVDLDVTQANSAGASPAVTRIVTIDRHADAPRVGNVDTGSGADTGLWFPILTGTAEPNATVEVTDGGSTDATVTADATGAWTTPQLSTLAVGSDLLTATQTDPAGNVSAAGPPIGVEVAAPPTTTVTGTGGGFDLTIAGVPGAALQSLADQQDGWGPTSLDSSGAYSAPYTWETTAGDHTVAVRYGSGSRWGPSSTATVTIG